ncbi:MAG: site-specific integrase, partial [Proteobacteria bacterium]|nr:site-specific integrase [Pseudomonadota bacterium]
MASIQERVSSDGKVSYRVQIRIKGQPTISETFNRKTDAKRWAEMTEAEVRDKKYFRKAESKNKTLNDAISRYLKLPFVQQKKTYKDKKTYLTWWGKELGSYTLIDLTPAKVAEKRDRLLSGKSERKEKLSPASVNRYLAALSHLCTVAVKEWGWLEFNPVSHVTKSKESRGRDRYLSDDERKKLLVKIKESKHSYLYAIVLLALSTGMRRGEIM